MSGLAPFSSRSKCNQLQESTSRGARRKKSALAEIKVAVVGAPHVGKSALTVRFLTRRYIGEYHHNEECAYKQEAVVDNELYIYEILDTCPKGLDLPSAELVQWADGICLVYSITDRDSFNHIRQVKAILPQDMVLTLVGNKADMIHLRQVSYEEGEILAKDFECPFSELTAAEQVTPIQSVFLNLIREVVANRRRTKHSLFNRVLGTGRATCRVYSRGKSDSALPKE